MVIFLDCSTERSSDRFFLLLLRHWRSCLAAVSCIAALFSRRAIRPIEEARWKSSSNFRRCESRVEDSLAIISANNDVLELTVGTSQWSDSIRNQVSRMDGLLQSMLAHEAGCTASGAAHGAAGFQLPDFSGGRVI